MKQERMQFQEMWKFKEKRKVKLHMITTDCFWSAARIFCTNSASIWSMPNLVGKPIDNSHFTRKVFVWHQYRVFWSRWVSWYIRGPWMNMPFKHPHLARAFFLKQSLPMSPLQFSWDLLNHGCFLGSIMISSQITDNSK